MRPRLRSAVRALLAWIAGTLLAAILGSIAQSLGALRALEALGIAIPLSAAGDTIAHDLVHFAPTWALVVALAYALALPAAAWLARRRPVWRAPLFALAGASAVLVALFAIRAATGLMPVASARSPLGIAGFALGAALGALASERLLASTRRAP